MADSASSKYLTDLSPKDKPWDKHRACADRVEDIYRGTIFDRYSIRMEDCSKILDFGLVNAENDEQRFKLLAARFCRVRHCPTCQSRRSMKWAARLFNALPAIAEKYPTHRWMLLTLTVRNCPISELRSQVAELNKGFKRLTDLKIFPGVGCIKSLEVTRGKDGSAHPHFHVLILVPSVYFGGRNYIKQERWCELWQKSMRLSYLPVVDIQAVKSKKAGEDGLAKAVCETLKYSVKEEDLVADADWLIELTKQLHKTRAVSVSGCLREFLREEKEDDDWVNIDDNDDESKELMSDIILRFGWQETKKKYKLI